MMPGRSLLSNAMGRSVAPAHSSRFAHRCATGSGGACRIWRSEMVADPLHRAVNAVIKRTDHRRARHQAHVWHRGQFSNRLARPIERGLPPTANVSAFNRPPKAKSSSARITSLPARPAVRAAIRPGRTSADNQQIAMTKALVIAVRVFVHRQRTKPCGSANNRLVHLFPERRRPHEGLVIKPCSQKFENRSLTAIASNARRASGSANVRSSPS